MVSLESRMRVLQMVHKRAALLQVSVTTQTSSAIQAEEAERLESE